MDPATWAILMGALVKYGPDIAEGIFDVFQKPKPTEEDFRAICKRAREYTYDQAVGPK